MSALPRRPDTLVIALGLCQMTGWGTTYYLPGVLAAPLSAATGLATPLIFASVTMMLILSSLTGVYAGRIMDRRGARFGLMLGGAMLSVGLTILSYADSPAGYFGAWALMGLAMPYGLSGASHVALVQARGVQGRRGISYVLLFTAASQAVFWPLTAWLDGMFGWRTTCLIFAAANLATVAAYRAALQGGVKQPDIREADNPDHVGMLAPDKRAAGTVLVVVALAMSGFVSWGLELHLLPLMLAFGVGQTAALAIISLRGPVSILARTVDLIMGRRFSPLDIALVGAGVMFLSLFLAQFGGGMAGAILFTVLFGAGTGVMTVARATLPLTLFGPVGYATLVGRIGLPTHFVYAIAPPIFGFAIEEFGIPAGLSLAMLSLSGSLAALFGLRRLVRG